MLVIFVLVFAVSFWWNIKHVELKPQQVFFLPYGRFWELLSGSILAWFTFYKRWQLHDNSGRVHNFYIEKLRLKLSKFNGLLLINIMSSFGFLLIIYSILEISKEDRFPGFWAIFPVLGAVLIIASGSKAWLNRVLLSNPMAVWCGKISYPLYLWHWPILSFLWIIEGEQPQNYVKIIAVVASVLLAWLTFVFVEKPIRYSKKKYLVSFLIFSSAVAGYMGFYISTHSLLEVRYPALSTVIPQLNWPEYNNKTEKCGDFIKNRNLQYCLINN